jgi:pimeloyl-ACP methyl ester carboxylesterase
MRRILQLSLLINFIAITMVAQASSADKNMELETSVCGLKEPFLFWLWSTMAGSPDKSRLSSLVGVEDISIMSADRRKLRGYKLRSRQDKLNGYLLVIQGNAILADQLLGEFLDYARAGFDVYIYDYRGYGRSQGKRRLKAIVSDIQQIIKALNEQPYKRRMVYAFSFGGIVLLDGYDKYNLDRIVVDSSPARLSNFGCPERYDPVSHLPQDCTQFMFISGGQDTVVPPVMSEQLMHKAGECGASVVIDPDLAHPFMETDYTKHQKRMRLLKTFFLNGEDN